MTASIPTNNEELLKGMRAGDENAFENFVRQFLPRSRSLAKRVLGTPCESRVDDVVQDAFLAAFRGLDGFSGSSKLSTWLHRIVVNAALMERRKRHVEGLEEIESLLPRFSWFGRLKEHGSEWDMSEVAAREELRSLTRAKIDELPDDYRTVIVLRDIEQFSTKETAAILDVSSAVVKTRLHRARQALRTLLDPLLGGEHR